MRLVVFNLLLKFVVTSVNISGLKRLILSIITFDSSGLFFVINIMFPVLQELESPALALSELFFAELGLAFFIMEYGIFHLVTRTGIT